MFKGIRFHEECVYRVDEAKPLLISLCDCLQSRKDLKALGVQPQLPRRSRITGTGQELIWDYLPLTAPDGKDPATRPHLSLDMDVEGLWAYFTAPNASRSRLVKALKDLGPEGFRDCVRRCAIDLSRVLSASRDAAPILRVLQRHYRGRTIPIVDGQLMADMRTAIPPQKGASSTVKQNPHWVLAAYSMLLEPEPNLQFSVGAHFQFQCPIIQSAEAVDLLADAWKALRPLIEPILSR